MTQHRPRITLWPIWTRLSRREPAPITVSRDDPRSIVLFAPTSTSSSRMTRPSWGTREIHLWWRRIQTLPVRSGRRDRRKHVLPEAHGLSSHVRQSGSLDLQSRRLPITAQGPIRQPGPISAPVSITDSGPTSADGSTRAPSATIADG
jgi:hypothetical protein